MHACCHFSTRRKLDFAASPRSSCSKIAKSLIIKCPPHLLSVFPGTIFHAPVAAPSGPAATLVRALGYSPPRQLSPHFLRIFSFFPPFKYWCCPRSLTGWPSTISTMEASTAAYVLMTSTLSPSLTHRSHEHQVFSFGGNGPHLQLALLSKAVSSVHSSGKGSCFNPSKPLPLLLYSQCQCPARALGGWNHAEALCLLHFQPRLTLAKSPARHCYVLNLNTPTASSLGFHYFLPGPLLSCL